jgi:peptidylprolyl isomerase
MSRVRSWSLVAVTASALVGLAGCSSSSTPTTTTAAHTTGSVCSTGSTGAVANIPVADQSPAGVTGKQPKVVVPSGTPPTKLECTDLIIGTGPAAKDGDDVTVQYVLATYSSHQVVQSSWTSQPFTFSLGGNSVITGWEEGVVGMKAGGRRELIIPPSLGYGAQSQGPGIAANDTLVFMVDMLKIN